METQNNRLPTNNTSLSLPREIIEEEIVPRFPVKSLLRFKCVSKSWRSLIDSKLFIKTHHRNSMQNPSFPQQSVILQRKGYLLEHCSLQSLSSKYYEPIDTSPLDVTNTSMERFQIVGCFNGLVCILNFIFPSEFYLWNPSTRIIKKLPKIGDYESTVVNCGFGWDESSGEYKVFAFWYQWYSDSDYRGRVYSSKTKSWKTIEHNLTDVPSGRDMAGVFVGGKLHWKGLHNDIIFFDLKSEVFGRIEVPFADKGNWYSEVLGQIGGLCLLDLTLTRAVRVWVMKESWERLVDLSLDHELLQRPFSGSSFIHEDSNGEIFVFLGSTLLVYDPQVNVFRVPKVSSRCFSCHVYVESLLSPEDV